MDDVLTVEEVVRFLRVHPMTVQRWCRTRSLPAAKIGRAHRIKREDLDRWWAERQVGAAPVHDWHHAAESEASR